MNAQTPDKNRIWDLTYSEFKVAHLAVQGSRRQDIAKYLQLSEKTISSQLRAVHKKLGNKGNGRQKRAALIRDYKDEIERIFVRDLDGDYEQFNRVKNLHLDRIRAIQEREKQPPHVEPAMFEPPPSPLVTWPITFTVIFTIVWVSWQFIRPAVTPPIIPPTPIPLPIREDFKESYSSLWQVSGDVFVGQSQSPSSIFDGVLKARSDNELVTLKIGNVSWTDYVVKLRADGGDIWINVLATSVADGISLECLGVSMGQGTCDWYIHSYTGMQKILEDEPVNMYENFTITVQGDTITAIGEPGENEFSGATFTSFTVPDEYKSEFPGGGIVLTLRNIEIDYIEILPLR